MLEEKSTPSHEKKKTATKSPILLIVKKKQTRTKSPGVRQA